MFACATSLSLDVDCSVVLTTYNRRDTLAGALDALMAQDAPGVSFEVIVVDNGSTDGTRELIDEVVKAKPCFRYVYEPARGPSSGRNAGIACSRGRVIAFTDDDNLMSHDWVAQIVRAFGRYPDIDAIAGRIIPKWSAETPAWLTRDHWVGPLSLQDYGDQPFVIDRSRPIALGTANLAFRRSVFDKIGVFCTTLHRAEDTELLVRMWRAGGRCMYVPEVLVAADVQVERMTKTYHRWWHEANGAWTSAFNLAEIIGRDGSLLREVPDVPRLYGVPSFLFREFLTVGSRYAGAMLRGDRSHALTHEYRLRYLAGYMGSRYQHHVRTSRQLWSAELWAFLTAVARRKLTTPARPSA